MRDHALIEKFVGIWPLEKALLWWINVTWKPLEQFNLHLGAKGFFTVIFLNLEDKNRIFERGPYFFNSVGLFLRPWKEKFNPDSEDLYFFPISIRLYSIPSEYWHENILEALGNSIGEFVKIVVQTKRMWYTSYATICIYMNIAKELPKGINLCWEEEYWYQSIDYEHILFRCRRCREHGNMLNNCPKNNPTTQ